MSDSNDTDSNDSEVDNSEVDTGTSPAADAATKQESASEDSDSGSKQESAQDPDGYKAKQAAAAESDSDEPYDPREDQPPYGEDDQDYVDRDAVDFDPSDGLYTGTAVDGSTKIPGKHPDLDERGVDVDVDDLGDGDEDDKTEDDKTEDDKTEDDKTEDDKTDSDGATATTSNTDRVGSDHTEGSEQHRPMPGPGEVG